MTQATVLSAGLPRKLSGHVRQAWPTLRATGEAAVRSLKALNFLRQQGFKYLKSVEGGITAWSEEIDSKVPRY
jgi:hypothetical protein